MRLPIALSALFAMLAIPVCGFQAFSGSACDGAAGADVACDGSCHAFDERHSFRADTSGDTHFVALFVGPGCAGQMFNFTGQTDECTNVNTGTNIRSFQCFGGSANSVSSDPPASAPTPSMSFSSTSSSTLDPQSIASISSPPPASAPSASSMSLSATGSSTHDVPLASPLINDNDGRGTGSGMKTGAIAGAAVGGVVALLLICGALWYYMRTSRPRRPTGGIGDIDNPIPSATPYSDHAPEDAPALVYRSPVSNGRHMIAPAMSPTSPTEMSAVSSSSPLSDADIALELARMRGELERLSRVADHDTPPRYEDGKD